MKLLMIVLSIVVSGACAAKTGPQLTAVDNAVHDALALADDGVRDFCEANTSMAAPCQDIRKTLLPAFEASDAFNRAVAEQRITAVVPLVEAIGRLIAQVRQLPESASATIIRDLVRVIAVASSFLPTGELEKQ